MSINKILDVLGDSIIKISVPIIPGIATYFTEIKISEAQIEDKIFNVLSSLQDTSELINELENDIKKRTKNVIKLKEEFDHYSKLNEIEQEKIQPLVKELDKAIAKNNKYEWLKGLSINLIAGLILILIGYLANPVINNIFDFKKEKVDNHLEVESNKTEIKENIKQ